MSASSNTTGAPRSRRPSNETSRTIRSIRDTFLSIIEVSACACGRSSVSSPINCAACLIADSGLRISCAMLADSRPNAANLICCAWASVCSTSSRKIRVPAFASRSTGIIRGARSRLPPSVRIGEVSNVFCPPKNACHRACNSGESSRRSTLGRIRASSPPSHRVACGFAITICPAAPTTSTPSSSSLITT